jgi:hypothetical protein
MLPFTVPPFRKSRISKALISVLAMHRSLTATLQATRSDSSVSGLAEDEDEALSTGALPTYLALSPAEDTAVSEQ